MTAFEERRGDAHPHRLRLGVGTDRVELPGRPPHEQVAAMVQSLDLMAMPSTGQERFGVAAIEASACKVPVVAHASEASPKRCSMGRPRCWCPHDVDAFVDACADLINDPARCRRFGGAGRRLVQETYP